MPVRFEASCADSVMAKCRVWGVGVGKDGTRVGGCPCRPGRCSVLCPEIGGRAGTEIRGTSGACACRPVRVRAFSRAVTISLASTPLSTSPSISPGLIRLLFCRYTVPNRFHQSVNSWRVPRSDTISRFSSRIVFVSKLRYIPSPVKFELPIETQPARAPCRR